MCDILASLFGSSLKIHNHSYQEIPQDGFRLSVMEASGDVQAIIQCDDGAFFVFDHEDGYWFEKSHESAFSMYLNLGQFKVLTPFQVGEMKELRCLIFRN